MLLWTFLNFSTRTLFSSNFSDKEESAMCRIKNRRTLDLSFLWFNFETELSNTPSVQVRGRSAILNFRNISVTN